MTPCVRKSTPQIQQSTQSFLLSSKSLALLLRMVPGGWQAKRDKEEWQKNEDPAELTFVYIGCCCIVVVSSVSKVVSEDMIYPTVFRTMKISHLDLFRSGLFLPWWTNSTKIDLAKRKGKCQIEVGSIEHFEKCSRDMESCDCVIARNANSNDRFACETKPQISHGNQ